VAGRLVLSLRGGLGRRMLGLVKILVLLVHGLEVGSDYLQPFSGFSEGS
jgi:hypothetical protein